MEALYIIAGAVVAAGPLALRLWAVVRAFRPYVWRSSMDRYGSNSVATVGVSRMFCIDCIPVAKVNLGAEDADEQLVAAKAEAKTKARLLNAVGT